MPGPSSGAVQTCLRFSGHCRISRIALSKAQASSCKRSGLACTTPGHRFDTESLRCCSQRILAELQCQANVQCTQPSVNQPERMLPAALDTLLRTHSPAMLMLNGQQNPQGLSTHSHFASGRVAFRCTGNGIRRAAASASRCIRAAQLDCRSDLRSQCCRASRTHRDRRRGLTVAHGIRAVESVDASFVLPEGAAQALTDLLSNTAFCSQARTHFVSHSRCSMHAWHSSSTECGRQLCAARGRSPGAHRAAVQHSFLLPGAHAACLLRLS